jgi:predicted molibdopterin-dependent oxidoreductase YjgC
MFRRLPDAAHDLVHFTIDGREAVARRGDSVAVALLAEGVAASRTTPVRGLPRGPYCLMGVCFDCLVVIDGVGSRQGCLVPVAEGMRVETQQGARAFPQDAPA